MSAGSSRFSLARRLPVGDRSRRSSRDTRRVPGGSDENARCAAGDALDAGRGRASRGSTAPRSSPTSVPPAATSTPGGSRRAVRSTTSRRSRRGGSASSRRACSPGCRRRSSARPGRPESDRARCRRRCPRRPCGCSGSAPRSAAARGRSSPGRGRRIPPCCASSPRRSRAPRRRAARGPSAPARSVSMKYSPRWFLSRAPSPRSASEIRK